MPNIQRVEQMELFPCNNVSKSNLLIEAKYRLSAAEQKLIWMVVSAIQPEDKDLMRYEFLIKDVVALMGLKSRGSYGTIEAIVDGLMEKFLTIRDTTTGDWDKYNWVSTSGYRSKEGIIYIEIDKKMKPFFIKLKGEFTTYKLSNILELKSGYSIRLYELLKQYQKLGQRTVTVKDLREYLAIEDDEYKLYTNFRKACILKPQAELAEKTDINFEFEEIKKGRSVHSIKFIISGNESRSEFIKRIFNVNNLFPSNTQIKQLDKALKDIADDDVFKITVRLRSVEVEGIVKKPIALFLAHPKEITAAIKTNTFYEMQQKPQGKKNTYEFYIPPDELKELTAKQEKALSK